MPTFEIVPLIVLVTERNLIAFCKERKFDGAKTEKK